VFDGAEDEDDVEGSRLPLLIVLALLVLAMFGGVVWLAYTQGVARGRGETPILTAANGPERVAPPQGGGNSVPYQGFKIYEQPAPSDDNADAAPPPASPPAASAAAPIAKPVPAPAIAAPPALKQLAAPEKPAPVKPVPAKPVPAAPPPKSVAALIQQANSGPQPAKPAAKPTPVKPAAVPPAAATGVPRPLGGTQMAAATPPAVASGSYVLQIGSYKSQAEAENAWKGYKAKHAALLAGYSDSIQQADLGEKGTWYRLRIGGFSDREVATALCDRLKADGGACIPGR
jgi:cell division protein FtsN